MLSGSVGSHQILRAMSRMIAGTPSSFSRSAFGIVFVHDVIICAGFCECDVGNCVALIRTLRSDFEQLAPERLVLVEPSLTPNYRSVEQCRDGKAAVEWRMRGGDGKANSSVRASRRQYDLVPESICRASSFNPHQPDQPAPSRHPWASPFLAPKPRKSFSTRTASRRAVAVKCMNPALVVASLEGDQMRRGILIVELGRRVVSV